LEKALALLALPKKGRGKAAPLLELGPHPDTGDNIQVLNGPYGPYVKHGKSNASVPDGQDPLGVTLEMALQYLDKVD
jgi:DNA topoisomerase-1